MEFDFKSAEKLADDIFNVAYVLDYFCVGNVGESGFVDYRVCWLYLALSWIY